MSGNAAHSELSLLAVGEQCSHSTCLLVDFLPLKCTHCNAKFVRRRGLKLKLQLSLSRSALITSNRPRTLAPSTMPLDTTESRQTARSAAPQSRLQ